jgi:signal transduction protein with GAF and PtsI domain
MDNLIGVEDSPVDLLHEIGGRLATAGGFHEVLDRVVEFASALVKCDSCPVDVLEGEYLVLRASKNAHPEVVDRLKLRVGQGITGWVAEHHEPVAISEKAAQDPRFQFLHELPEDSYEAFLSVPLMCRGRVVGAINLQHRRPHIYKQREIRLISAIGFWWARKLNWRGWRKSTPTLRTSYRPEKWWNAPKGFCSTSSD